ncbi:uncharacterized protein LOC108161272 isoform X2 [Drosophila miranda]|uniref:uncharacterized protein LOC108161272 isoform X2 n=1 Tax=Drosophila miranda TaxID=7229 RepID=UPI00143F481E|nr:uncharacterized protein LOC108161272 isoform X2 [Drosophila miranda]XP_033251781.1 uncharacterized protein LOC108161272 isoform X2 [Drosophila miranda]
MSSSDMEFEVHSSSKVVPSSVGVGPRMPPQQQQHPQHMAAQQQQKISAMSSPLHHPVMEASTALLSLTDDPPHDQLVEQSINLKVAVPSGNDKVISSLQSEHKQQLDTVQQAPIHKGRKLVDQVLMEKEMDKVETDVQSSIYFLLEEDEQLSPLGTKINSNHLETKGLSITRNVANLIRYASHITDFDENYVYFKTRVVGIFAVLCLYHD